MNDQEHESQRLRKIVKDQARGISNNGHNNNVGNVLGNEEDDDFPVNRRQVSRRAAETC